MLKIPNPKPKISIGRTLFFATFADAHRCYGQRFIVRANEELTAFVELESAIRVEKIKAFTSSRDCKLPMPNMIHVLTLTSRRDFFKTRKSKI